MQLLVGIVCFILAIFGIIEIIRRIMFFMLRSDEKNQVTVVVTPENGEQCEYAVRAAAEKIRWLEMPGSSRVVCLNISEDKEINAICKRLSLRYPYLSVSNTRDLGYNIMQEISDGKGKDI